jgi:hypothetical protein
MPVVKYTVRRVRIRTLFKFGCILGVLNTLGPAVAAVAIGHTVAGILRRWLESWGTTKLELVVTSLELNFLDLLHLSRILDTVRSLDALAWPLLLLGALAAALGVGFLVALTFVLAGLVYNGVAALSGGVEVTLAPVAEVPLAAGPATATAPPVKMPTRPLPKPTAATSVPPTWVILATDQSQRWPIASPNTRLGSAPDNDIVLPDLLPRHAELRYEGGRFVLYNLGDGVTKVNGRQITGPNMVKDGFRIRFAATQYLFRTG